MTFWEWVRTHLHLGPDYDDAAAIKDDVEAARKLVVEIREERHKVAVARRRADLAGVLREARRMGGHR